MAKREILAGSTNQTIDVVIEDVNGSPLTGLVYNSSGLTCYYREGATGTSTALTLATQTVGGAHSDGGFVEIDATNMPGLYRLDLSDTMVDTAGMLLVVLNGYAGMAPCRMEIEVVAVDKYNATSMGISKFADIEADTQNIQTRLPAALVSGRMDSDVAVIQANVMNASALATDAVTEIVNAIIAIDVDGQDLQEALRIALAILAGKSSGLSSGYGTGVFRDIADTKNRATVAISADGNRTSVTLDGT